MKLFHGTSEKKYDDISSIGLKSPSYLTDEVTEAGMWAGKTSKLDESKPIVLEVDTPYACLRLDPLRLIESVNYPDDVIEEHDPDYIAREEYNARKKQGMSHEDIIDWGLKTCESVECVCDIPVDKIKRIS